ncbi:hypothetical protein O0L34_g10503 [Tuta absoluta]|nr:hypothetical protein O0L34_g10503 [Tuta absoluta]
MAAFFVLFLISVTSAFVPTYKPDQAPVLPVNQVNDYMRSWLNLPGIKKTGPRRKPLRRSKAEILNQVPLHWKIIQSFQDEIDRDRLAKYLFTKNNHYDVDGVHRRTPVPQID